MDQVGSLILTGSPLSYGASDETPGFLGGRLSYLILDQENPRPSQVWRILVASEGRLDWNSCSMALNSNVDHEHAPMDWR
jgi:hypothetical protein